MKKLLVCFDVDGTLIDDTIFIWQTLHDAFDTDRTERRRWADAFWNREITYTEWANHDVTMWREKGVTRDDIMAQIRDLRAMTGARETLQGLLGCGHMLGVISGSLDVALETVFPEWRDLFDHVFLNRLVFGDGDRLDGITATPYDIDHKADGLKTMAKKTGIPMSDTVFIGDHFNDVSVAKLAGLSIAFNCKSDELAAVSDVVVEGADLRDILPVIAGFAANGNHTELNSAKS